MKLAQTFLFGPALLIAASLIQGCASGNEVPGHTGDEQKLVNELKNETPEQQIERVQKGPMPQAAKDAMIKKIKEEHGLK